MEPPFGPPRPPAGAPLAEGELIMLFDRQGRRYPVRLRAGGRFDFARGSVRHDQIIGQPEGAVVYSSVGEPLIAVRPRLADYILKMPRRTQVIYPKDIGSILVWADIFPGARVLEAGIGSGALTLALLRAVGPAGQVIAYETRPEFLNLALRNIGDFLGTPPNLITRLADVYEGIEETDLDRVLLDVPEPWRAVPHAARALRPGGIIMVYLPTTIQVHQAVMALVEHPDFGLIEAFETLHRPWDISRMSMRPAHRMVAHTGFIIVARRVVGPVPDKGGTLPGEPP